MEGEPEIGLPVNAPEVEARGHHADDLVGIAVDLHSSAQDVRCPTETALPKAMAENHHRRTTLGSLFRGVGAPQHWLDAQDLEEAVGAGGGRNPLRIPFLGEVPLEGEVQPHGLVDLVLGLVLVEDPGGGSELVVSQVRGPVPEPHDPIGIRIGKGLQEHPVHRAEYGGGGPDAQRQSEGRHDGEPGSPGQRPDRIPHFPREDLPHGISLSFFGSAPWGPSFPSRASRAEGREDPVSQHARGFPSVPASGGRDVSPGPLSKLLLQIAQYAPAPDVMGEEPPEESGLDRRWARRRVCGPLLCGVRPRRRARRPGRVRRSLAHWPSERRSSSPASRLRTASLEARRAARPSAVTRKRRMG